MSQIININAASIDKVLASTDTVLIDFWAPWCAPCVALAPILEALAIAKPELSIAKVNVDDEGELAARFQVRGIPALLLFKDGKHISTKVGNSTQAQLEQWLSENLI